MFKSLFKTLVAVLAIAAAAAGPAWGQNSSTSSLVFSDWYSTGGATADDNVVWTVTSDGTESNYDGTKGIHFGTGKAQVQYIQLSTSGIEGTITQVKVNASTANDVNATVGVTVGGDAFGGNAQSLSSTATDYTFTGSASGAIVVRVEKPSAAYKALYVKSIEVTYTPASSGGGSGSETPTPGQNATTYNVTFGGFNYPELNTTVNVASLPQTFTSNFNPPSVVRDECYGFTGASVTSGGEGNVSASVVTFSEMSITVSGTFEGTATIHVTGKDDEERDISTDVYVSCVAVAPAAPTPHTVRFADGNDGWTVTDVDSARSATAPAVLQNVMAGDSLVVTAPASLPGKVKSVKAVKYVPPEVITWNSTNVFNSDHMSDRIIEWQSGSCTFEGITISKSGEDLSSFYAYDGSAQKGSLACFGNNGDSFTFTAPSGKKFCKIEIIDNEGVGYTNYGDWTGDVINNKIVWSGTAANAVTLGTVYTSALNLNSIVFTLIDAQ